jgi:hypothetical protein
MIKVKMNEYHRVLVACTTLVTAMSLLGGLSVGIAYAQFSTDQTTSLALQQGEWSPYQNVTHGVSMVYPSNWTQQNSTGDPDDRFIYVSDFFSPEETDGYFAYVTVAIDNMPNTTNIESYRNQSIDIYRQDPEFQEFQLLSSSIGNFTLAGEPAYSLEIAYTDLEFGPQNMLEVGRMFENRVYYIQYFADTPIYQKYFPIVERMIESFQITQ